MVSVNNSRNYQTSDKIELLYPFTTQRIRFATSFCGQVFSNGNTRARTTSQQWSCIAILIMSFDHGAVDHSFPMVKGGATSLVFTCANSELVSSHAQFLKKIISYSHYVSFKMPYYILHVYKLQAVAY